MSAFSKGADEGERLSDSCAETERRQRCHTQHMSQLQLHRGWMCQWSAQRSASVTSVTDVDVAVLLVPVGLHVQEMLNWPVEWNTTPPPLLPSPKNKTGRAKKKKEEPFGVTGKASPVLTCLPLFCLVSAVIIGLAALFLKMSTSLFM